MQSVISKIHSLWGSSFFSKCSKFDLNFRDAAKNWGKIISFLDNCSWIQWGKIFLLRREYMTSGDKMLANTRRISDTLRWTLSNLTFAKVTKQSHGSAVMEIFRLFNMLTVARCSQARLFTHLTNYIFCRL